MPTGKMMFELRKDQDGWYIHFEGFGRMLDGMAHYPTPEAANAGVEALLVELQKDIPELCIMSQQYE